MLLACEEAAQPRAPVSAAADLDGSISPCEWCLWDARQRSADPLSEAVWRARPDLAGAFAEVRIPEDTSAAAWYESGAEHPGHARAWVRRGTGEELWIDLDVASGEVREIRSPGWRPREIEDASLDDWREAFRLHALGRKWESGEPIPMDVLRRMVRSTGSHERAAAVALLGERGDAASIGLLADAPCDPDAAVRRAAVEAIGVAKDRAWVSPWLVDPDVHVADAARDVWLAAGPTEEAWLAGSITTSKWMAGLGVDPATASAELRGRLEPLGIQGSSWDTRRAEWTARAEGKAFPADSAVTARMEALRDLETCAPTSGRYRLRLWSPALVAGVQVEIGGATHTLQGEEGVADLDVDVAEVPRQALVSAGDRRETVALSPFRATSAAVLCTGTMPVPTSELAVAGWGGGAWAGKADCEAIVVPMVGRLPTRLQQGVLLRLPAAQARDAAGPEVRRGLLRNQLLRAEGDEACAPIVAALVELGSPFSVSELRRCDGAGPKTRDAVVRGLVAGLVRGFRGALSEAERAEIQSAAIARMLGGDEGARAAATAGVEVGIISVTPPIDGVEGVFYSRRGCARGASRGEVVDRVVVLGADRPWVALRGAEAREVELALCGGRVVWEREEGR